MCKSCGWEDLIEQIDELLEDDDYEFALDTLEGIRAWVAENEHCTENQQQAIENIANARR